MGKKSKRKQASDVVHVWAVMNAGFLGGDSEQLVWCRFPVQYERGGMLAISGFDGMRDPMLTKPLWSYDMTIWRNRATSWFIPKADLASGAKDETDGGKATFYAHPWPLGTSLRDQAVAALAFGAWQDHQRQAA